MVKYYAGPGFFFKCARKKQFVYAGKPGFSKKSKENETRIVKSSLLYLFSQSSSHLVEYYPGRLIAIFQKKNALFNHLI
jgi:hypothetical protein